VADLLALTLADAEPALDGREDKYVTGAPHVRL
jgi:hypothetical protein